VLAKPLMVPVFSLYTKTNDIFLLYYLLLLNQTLRARITVKAEEKKLELLFLRWNDHHQKLSNFIRYTFHLKQSVANLSQLSIQINFFPCIHLLPQVIFKLWSKGVHIHNFIEAKISFCSSG